MLKIFRGENPKKDSLKTELMRLGGIFKYNNSNLFILDTKTIMDFAYPEVLEDACFKVILKVKDEDYVYDFKGNKIEIVAERYQQIILLKEFIRNINRKITVYIQINDEPFEMELAYVLFFCNGTEIYKVPAKKSMKENTNLTLLATSSIPVVKSDITNVKGDTIVQDANLMFSKKIKSDTYKVYLTDDERGMYQRIGKESISVETIKGVTREKIDDKGQAFIKEMNQILLTSGYEKLLVTY